MNLSNFLGSVDTSELFDRKATLALLTALAGRWIDEGTEVEKIHDYEASKNTLVYELKFGETAFDFQGNQIHEMYDQVTIWLADAGIIVKLDSEQEDPEFCLIALTA